MDRLETALPAARTIAGRSSLLPNPNPLQSVPRSVSALQLRSDSHPKARVFRRSSTRSLNPERRYDPLFYTASHVAWLSWHIAPTLL